MPFSISRQMRCQCVWYVLYRCSSIWKRKRCAVLRICSLRRTWMRRSTSLRGTAGSSFSIPMKYCS